MLVGHAFTLPMALLFPKQDSWTVTTVPVAINTVQFLLPAEMGACFASSPC